MVEVLIVDGLITLLKLAAIGVSGLIPEAPPTGCVPVTVGGVVSGA